MSSGDTSALPELHATSSGLKSFMSTIAAEGIEQCRLACGGHGYSRSSGFTDLYPYFTHLATAEVGS
jgi:acyl-CoA oxidase